jgi:hypothetical protein
MPRIPDPHVPAPTDRLSEILTDPAVARQYLRQVSVACAEGATADDPRVTLLALGLLARAGSELEGAAQ